MERQTAGWNMEDLTGRVWLPPSCLALGKLFFLRFIVVFFDVADALLIVHCFRVPAGLQCRKASPGGVAQEAERLEAARRQAR